MNAMRQLCASVLVTCVGCLSSPEPYVPGLALATTVHCVGGPCEQTSGTAQLPVGFVAHVTAWNVFEEGKINAAVTYTWTPESSVIVEGPGGLHGVAPGVATLTVTNLDYPTHGTIKIEVVPITSVSIGAPSGTTVAVDSTLELYAFGHYGSRMGDLRSSESDIPVWSSADESIAVIEVPAYRVAPQLIRAVAPGQTTIATSFRGMSASIDITVE